MYANLRRKCIHTILGEILTKIMLESALRKKKISKVYLKVSKFSACGGQSTFTMNKFIDPGYRGPKWCNILKISKKLYVLQKPNKKHWAVSLYAFKHRKCGLEVELFRKNSKQHHNYSIFLGIRGNVRDGCR